MNNESNNRIDELMALAALGELTDSQNAELDAAMAADAAVSDELHSDLGVAARLQSTRPVIPPPSMKQSVLDAIANEPQVANPVPATAEQAPPPSTELLPPATPPVADIGRARGRRWQALAAAAAVIMLVVGGVLVAGRDAGQSQFDSIATASDAQRRPLVGDLDGMLAVIWSARADAFVLEGTDVAAVTDAETYQLWLVDADGARSAGVFRPDANGNVEQVFNGLDPSDFVVGITVEPAGGSQTPTLPIVAST